MHKRLATLTPLVIVAAGCATLVPKTTSVSKIAASNAVAATTHAVATPADVTPVSAKAASPLRQETGPFRELSETDAMTEIAPLLGEIASADPELHAEVLKQLGGTKPSLWSLTVQRAQQTLAYRQQLAGVTPAKQPTGVSNAIVQASATTQLPTEPLKATPLPIRSLPPVTKPPLPTVVSNTSSQQAPPNVISNVYYTSEDRTAHDASATASIQLASSEANSDSLEVEPVELSWQEHLDAAIAGMAKESTDDTRSPDEAREQVRLNLMQLAAGRTDDAVGSISGLSAVEQGYWSNQLYALSTMLDSERSADRRVRADATAHHQNEASAKLRALGSLQIRNFTTCREIYGFGAYEPIRDPEYAPGDSITLYAEIDNYKSDVTTDGYRTAISSSYHLVSADGTEAASGDFPEVDDLCLTRRRDFHIQYTVPLPRGLRGGEYRLELTVTDELGSKTGHDELRLTVQSR
ncbi:MAG: hypothetical protein AAF266_03655 [Planctomycetota bacterium]